MKGLVCMLVAATMSCGMTTTAMAADPAALDPPTVVDFVAFGAFGDADGDGLKDFASMSAGPGEQSTYYSRQSSRGVFDPPQEVATAPLGPASLSVLLLADVAGDPRAEQIVALLGQTDHIAHMQPPDALLLPKDQRFWSLVPIAGPSGGRAVTAAAAGDVTGDGRPDAVLITSDPVEGSGLVLIRNDSGTPTISASPTVPDGLGPSIELADVDGDRILDVVGVTSAGQVVFASIATGSFGILPGTEQLTGFTLVRVGRLSHDRVPDLATIRGGRFAILIGRRRPSGVPYYAEQPITAPAGLPCGIDAGRLNGDRLDDLALLGACAIPSPEQPPQGEITTLVNDGTGAFVDPAGVAPTATGAPVRGVAIDDLNGDGLGEIITAGTDTSTVVYMNSSVVVPRLPSRRCRPRCPTVTITPDRAAWKATRALRVALTCNRPCSLRMRAQLFFSRGRRGRVVASFALPAPNRGRPIYADRTTRAIVPFELKAARRRAVLRYLRRGLHGVARLSVTVSDEKGAKTFRASVRVTR